MMGIFYAEHWKQELDRVFAEEEKRVEASEKTNGDRDPGSDTLEEWRITLKSLQRAKAAIYASDPVNHPKHYTSDPSGIECITITRHRTFNVGNAIKYLWRAGLKDSADQGKQIEDLNKARWYIQDEIVRLGGVVK